MSFTEETISVIKRALPKEKIKQRPGGGGMTFDYITPATAIDLLNEAFGYSWSSRIVDKFRDGDIVIVAVELSVIDDCDQVSKLVSKQQYGSCQITRGLGVGEAYKGAASDALKKAATHFGIGLELYQEDGPVSNFVAPKSSPSHPPVDKETTVFPQKPTPPPNKETKPGVLPKKTTAAAPNADPFAVFDNEPSTSTAEVKKPTPAPPAPSEPARLNPFGKKSVGEAEGPNSTQLNALKNLATRKSFSPEELIALASVVDSDGHPKTEFDDLKYDEAIQVIRSAQQ